MLMITYTIRVMIIIVILRLIIIIIIIIMMLTIIIVIIIRGHTERPHPQMSDVIHLSKSGCSE